MKKAGNDPLQRASDSADPDNRPLTVQLIMNAATSLLVFLALVAGPASWAQDKEPARRNFGNGVRSEFLSMYDVNNDGQFSAEELQVLKADRSTRDRRDRFRERWDTDKDGRISDSEREAAVATIREAIRQRRCDRFDEVDLRGAGEADGPDGFLSRDEFKNISAVSLINSDNPEMADSLFDKLDRDRDGRISKAEFLRTLDEVRPVPTGGEQPAPKPHEARSRDGGRR